MAAKARRLAVYVTVAGDPSSGQGFATFGPDDEVPDWAAKQMGDHVWANGGSDPDADAAARAAADADAKAKADADAAASGIPARAGAGSSKEAWTEYAGSLNVDVAEAKTRDDIIAAIEAAGHPTERPAS